MDLTAEAFIAVTPDRARTTLAVGSFWEAFWPGLVLDVTQDRGLRGVRWSVSGRLSGSAEVWLEPWREAVVVHVYLRAPDRRLADRLLRRYDQAMREALFLAKDRLEGTRAPAEVE